MSPDQERAVEEQRALLEDSDIYRGEKEPETKDEENNKSEVVNGLPAGPGGPVVGAPVSRTPWSSGLFACFGRNDEFCGSDLEVCILGTFAPCVLYGSNVERLYSSRTAFSNHCLRYSSLYFLGTWLFGYNVLAPCFSYPSRSAIRRKFNLEGNGEYLARTVGCCSTTMADDERSERCESLIDFATHIFCHKCSLCQESRELRRRLPHPALVTHPHMPMIPPLAQHMAPPSA